MDVFTTMRQWRQSLAIFTVFATAAILPAVCLAGNSACGHGMHHERLFDGSTLCRWHRTWHGPNAVFQPLNPYYMPRPADACKFGEWHGHRGGGGCVGCAAGLGAGYAAEYPEGEPVAYAPGAIPGMSAGLERLGQIPNDLGISESGPLPASAAPRLPAGR